MQFYTGWSGKVLLRRGPISKGMREVWVQATLVSGIVVFQAVGTANGQNHHLLNGSGLDKMVY